MYFFSLKKKKKKRNCLSRIRQYWFLNKRNQPKGSTRTTRDKSDRIRLRKHRNWCNSCRKAIQHAKNKLRRVRTISFNIQIARIPIKLRMQFDNKNWKNY